MLFTHCPHCPCRQLRRTTAVSVLGVAAVGLWAGATLYLAALLALTGRAHALRPWPAWELLHRPWQHAALEIGATLPVILLAFM